MKNLVLSVVLGLGLALAGFGVPQANAQYGYGHGHGHCPPGFSGYRGGYIPGGYYGGGFYGGGFGGYNTGYRGVPPIILGQIQTGYPVYRTLPYDNFGGFYRSGYSGLATQILEPGWDTVTAQAFQSASVDFDHDSSSLIAERADSLF